MFKEGDKVKVKVQCSGALPGIIYTLGSEKEPNGKTILKILNKNNPLFAKFLCSCQDNWILVKHKKIDIRKLNKSLI